jgi:hypothetical protein
MNGLGSGKSGCKGNGKGGGLNIASSGVWTSREAVGKQWELWRSSFAFRLFSLFF